MLEWRVSAMRLWVRTESPVQASLKGLHHTFHITTVIYEGGFFSNLEAIKIRVITGSPVPNCTTSTICETLDYFDVYNPPSLLSMR
jgi:hypothetical protein